MHLPDHPYLKLNSSKENNLWCNVSTYSDARTAVLEMSTSCSTAKTPSTRRAPAASSEARPFFLHMDFDRMSMNSGSTTEPASRSRGHAARLHSLSPFPAVRLARHTSPSG